MSDSGRKIKNFSNFKMGDPSYYKMLNKLVISGEHTPFIFSKKEKFEITIFYTPLKGKIMDIKLNNIEQFDFPFFKGDNISVIREWIKKNGYKVSIDKKRI